MTSDINDLELGDDLRITKTTRRASGGGTWVCGTIAGHRFDALVFPEHAENPEWEIGDSRISKLWVQRLGRPPDGLQLGPRRRRTRRPTRGPRRLSTSSVPDWPNTSSPCNEPPPERSPTCTPPNDREQRKNMRATLDVAAKQLVGRRIDSRPIHVSTRGRGLGWSHGRSNFCSTTAAPSMRRPTRK